MDGVGHKADLGSISWHRSHRGSLAKKSSQLNDQWSGNEPTTLSGCGPAHACQPRLGAGWVTRPQNRARCWGPEQGSKSGLEQARVLLVLSPPACLKGVLPRANPTCKCHNYVGDQGRPRHNLLSPRSWRSTGQDTAPWSHQRERNASAMSGRAAEQA